LSHKPCSLPAERYPYIRQLQEDCAALRGMWEEAERYAKSLEAELNRRPVPEGGLFASLKRRLRPT